MGELLRQGPPCAICSGSAVTPPQYNLWRPIVRWAGPLDLRMREHNALQRLNNGIYNLKRLEEDLFSQLTAQGRAELEHQIEVERGSHEAATAARTLHLVREVVARRLGLRGRPSLEKPHKNISAECRDRFTIESIDKGVILLPDGKRFFDSEVGPCEELIKMSDEDVCRWVLQIATLSPQGRPPTDVALVSAAQNAGLTATRDQIRFAARQLAPRRRGRPPKGTRH